MTSKILRSPIAWGVTAILLVVAPQLRFAQFNTDDYTQLAVLENIETNRGMGPWDLYGFVDGDPELLSKRISEGPSTWYADPSEKILFFRPLSSALMALNHKIAGLDPLPYALHSLVWYGMEIVFLGLLVTMIFPRPRSGRIHPAVYIVLVLFAFSGNHCSTVMWNAARWILVSSVLSLAGLTAHLKWRVNCSWGPDHRTGIIQASEC